MLCFGSSNRMSHVQVYAFTGGKVKVANKKFSSFNAEYELNFDSSTQINPISDDSRISSATLVHEQRRVQLLCFAVLSRAQI